MRQFLRAFVTAWRLSSVGVIETGADWTPEDAASLSRFFASKAGAKIRRMLRDTSLRANARAVQQATAFQCGLATGYISLCHDLQNLSAHSEPKSEPRDADQEHSALLDQLAP